MGPGKGDGAGRGRDRSAGGRAERESFVEGYTEARGEVEEDSGGSVTAIAPGARTVARGCDKSGDRVWRVRGGGAAAAFGACRARSWTGRRLDRRRSCGGEQGGVPGGLTRQANPAHGDGSSSKPRGAQLCAWRRVAFVS